MLKNLSPKYIKEVTAIVYNSLTKNGVLKTLKKSLQYLIVRSYKYKQPIITDKVKNNILNFSYKPNFVVFIITESPILAEETLESLKVQWYPYWKYTLINIKDTKQIEKKFGLCDCESERQEYEYAIIVSDNCILTPDFTYNVTMELNSNMSDFLYFDEDAKVSKSKYSQPLFKPDFSYHLLLSINYIGECVCVSKSVLKNIIKTNQDSLEAFFYDLIIKITSSTKKIKHIAKVLFHRKSANKRQLFYCNTEIIGDYLSKSGKLAEVSLDKISNSNDINYKIPNNLLISLIVPTKDKINYLKNFIESIFRKSTYKNYEIIIIDNNSVQAETFAWFDFIKNQHKNVKVYNAPHKFNWSKLNNLGIAKSNGDILIFLNNDMEVITPDWMERLAGDALQPGVGTVGALLLFEDKTIQHAGITIGLNDWCGNLYRFCKINNQNTPFISPIIKRNVSANTGACMCVSKKVINQIGNFNESFEITNGDVEFSLRALENGLSNIYNPHVKLFHYEGKSRGNKVINNDLFLGEKVLSKYLKKGDPNYNANLSPYSSKPKIR